MSKTRAAADTERAAQTALIRRQFDNTQRNLASKVWTLRGSSVRLTPGEFDRNTKRWPFIVESEEILVPVLPRIVVAEPGKSANPVAAIKALDAAVKANALVAEIDWGITHYPAKDCYSVDLRAVRILDLASDSVVARYATNAPVQYFTAGKRAAGTLTVTAGANGADTEVFINGVSKGPAPFTGKLWVGDVDVEIRYSDTRSLPFKARVTVAQGRELTVEGKKTIIYQIGDTGPAGGIVCFDKGNFTDGWRWLEVSPVDLTDKTVWNVKNKSRISTKKQLGSGASNTAIIVSDQGKGSYAAALCDEYVLNGFDDWFLPSIEELYNVYKNCRLIGTWKKWYWSSSQDEDGFAEIYYFSGVTGEYPNMVAGKGPVRACRAF